MRLLDQTPSQTVGPFFTMRLGAGGENVIDGHGLQIVITGTVLDGERRPIEDALLEVWQANSAGRYRHPDDSRVEIPLDPEFTGFARCATDFVSGSYRFHTVKPGQVVDVEGGLQAPHVSLIVQARGMLNPQFTRIYFSDETEANKEDFVLRRVPVSRWPTLTAELVEGSDPPEYRHDIRFQGEGETVFFDF